MIIEALVAPSAKATKILENAPGGQAIKAKVGAQTTIAIPAGTESISLDLGGNSTVRFELGDKKPSKVGAAEFRSRVPGFVAESAVATGIFFADDIVASMPKEEFAKYALDTFKLPPGVANGLHDFTSANRGNPFFQGVCGTSAGLITFSVLTLWNPKMPMRRLAPIVLAVAVSVAVATILYLTLWASPAP